MLGRNKECGFMFTSNDVSFRKLEECDVSWLTELKLESWNSTHQTLFLNKRDQMKWFESLDSSVTCPNNLILMAFDSHDMDVSVTAIGAIGRIGIFKIFDIDWISRRCDCAWDVFEYKRKQGWGKKLVIGGTDFCFNMLNLRRLDCEILDTNIASKKCAEAAGWRMEGRKEECIYKSGVGYIDSLVYGNLRINWQGHSSSQSIKKAGQARLDLY